MLYQRLSEYQRFKNDIEEIVSNLKKSLEPLELASQNLYETFEYNGYSADNKSIANDYSKINNFITIFEQQVLPDITRNINSINRRIADEEMAQALNASI